MSLVFYDKSHRYKLDGAWVPGVTTLLKKGLPKPALVYWSAKAVAEFVADNEDALVTMRSMGRGPMVAALKAVPRQERDDKAARGTEVHALAERVAHGEEVEVPEYIAGHVQGYVEWLDRENPEVLYTECPVASRKWLYAGTFDLIARFRGATWLLDVKTASGVYGDNALQLAAYSNAEFLVNEQDEEVPLPQIDRLGVLHVTDGGTHLYPITDPEAAWKDFLHVAWTGRAEERIKSYIGEELTAEDIPA
jgi:hypothetical protein